MTHAVSRLIDHLPRQLLGIALTACLMGSFSGCGQDTGAIPGKYEVRIFSTDNEAAPEQPEAPPGPESEQRPLQPERIDKRYNVESELTAEIPEQGVMDLSFELDT